MLSLKFLDSARRDSVDFLAASPSQRGQSLRHQILQPLVVSFSPSLLFSPLATPLPSTPSRIPFPSLSLSLTPRFLSPLPFFAHSFPLLVKGIYFLPLSAVLPSADWDERFLKMLLLHQRSREPMRGEKVDGGREGRGAGDGGERGRQRKREERLKKPPTCPSSITAPGD
ncbi:hypothetical protein IE53DRAFT_101475 [Violaceomyces palustris]|uniref:Uncharacterized protein n=1 Tax=Violaceomyces palustris TaxID=1673888 RepID=A0ACD0NX63_9BASI|nr:hypothetical protein IE53DRAFT_101475 [Violaceomyces palustris]